MYVINRIYLLFTIREIRPHTTTYNHHIVRISKLRVDTRLYVNRKKMNWFIQLEESAVTPTTLLQAFTFTTTTKTDTFVKGQDTTHTHKVRITYFTYFSHLYLTYISIYLLYITGCRLYWHTTWLYKSTAGTARESPTVPFINSYWLTWFCFQMSCVEKSRIISMILRRLSFETSSRKSLQIVSHKSSNAQPSGTTAGIIHELTIRFALSTPDQDPKADAQHFCLDNHTS